MEAKEKILRECQECQGRGCGECLKKLRIIDRLGEANIPVTYWFTKLKNFPGPPNIKEAAITYVTHLKENYEAGKGLCFAGTYGTGKTTALCAILKASIFHGLNSYYTTLSDLVSYSSDYATRDEYVHLTTRCDFLAIDEVDSRHFSSSEEAQKFLGAHFERTLRYRIQNKLPVLLATNNASLEEVFTGQFRRVVASITAASITEIPALGKDIRLRGADEPKSNKT